jgi:hypothetical protein
LIKLSSVSVIESIMVCIRESSFRNSDVKREKKQQRSQKAKSPIG